MHSWSEFDGICSDICQGASTISAKMITERCKSSSNSKTISYKKKCCGTLIQKKNSGSAKITKITDFLFLSRMTLAIIWNDGVVCGGGVVCVVCAWNVRMFAVC